MMNRTFLFLASMFLTPSVAFASFSDVPASHPNAVAIEYLQEHKIVAGYSDGTFRPNQRINRAEFLKILIEKIQRTGGIIPSEADAQKERQECVADRNNIHFKDVQENEWYAGYVCFGSVLSLINGYPDGTFRPDTSISFVEAASILSADTSFLAEWKKLSYPAGSREGSNPWYKYAVDFLALNHAIPTTVTSFDQFISRGEMAEMIYRLMTQTADRPSKTFDELR